MVALLGFLPLLIEAITVPVCSLVIDYPHPHQLRLMHSIKQSSLCKMLFLYRVLSGVMIFLHSLCDMQAGSRLPALPPTLANLPTSTIHDLPYFLNYTYITNG